MDSMDWFTPSDLGSSKPTSLSSTPKLSRSKSTQGTSAALNQILALHRVLKPGGRVLFRSASIRPWYADIFESNGFEVRCVAARHSGRCIDRVNMYASTYICTRLNDDGTVPLPRPRTPGSPNMTRNNRGEYFASGSVSGSSVDGEEDYRGRNISPKMTKASKTLSRNSLKDLDLGPPGLEN